MTISLHGNGAVANGSSPITVTVPAVSNGDFMVMGVSTSNGTGGVTTPGGWNPMRTDTGPAGAAPKTVLFKRIASGEPASYSVSGSGGGTLSGQIRTYSGNIVVEDTDGGQGNSSSTSDTATAISLANQVEMVVGFWTWSVTESSYTLPSGFGNSASQTSAAPGFLSGDQVFSNAGSTGAQTATAATAGTNVGQLIALKETGDILSQMWFFREPEFPHASFRMMARRIFEPHFGDPTQAVLIAGTPLPSSVNPSPYQERPYLAPPRHPPNAGDYVNPVFQGPFGVQPPPINPAVFSFELGPSQYRPAARHEVGAQAYLATEDLLTPPLEFWDPLVTIAPYRITPRHEVSAQAYADATTKSLAGSVLTPTPVEVFSFDLSPLILRRPSPLVVSKPDLPPAPTSGPQDVATMAQWSVTPQIPRRPIRTPVEGNFVTNLNMDATQVSFEEVFAFVVTGPQFNPRPRFEQASAFEPSAQAPAQVPPMITFDPGSPTGIVHRPERPRVVSDPAPKLTAPEGDRTLAWFIPPSDPVPRKALIRPGVTQENPPLSFTVDVAGFPLFSPAGTPAWLWRPMRLDGLIANYADVPQPDYAKQAFWATQPQVPRQLSTVRPHTPAEAQGIQFWSLTVATLDGWNQPQPETPFLRTQPVRKEQGDWRPVLFDVETGFLLSWCVQPQHPRRDALALPRYQESLSFASPYWGSLVIAQPPFSVVAGEITIVGGPIQGDIQVE